jgi:hypothetical protein
MIPFRAFVNANDGQLVLNCPYLNQFYDDGLMLM